METVLVVILVVIVAAGAVLGVCVDNGVFTSSKKKEKTKE